MDKQRRLMFAEHVVYCRRADRLKITYIHWLLQLVTLGLFQLPKIHMAIVKYGDSPISLVTERWFYQGAPLYSAYDTKQQFSDFYAHGAFCVLPPHYYALKRSKMNVSFFMRLTKIYFKRAKRLSLILSGVLLCFVGQFFYHKYSPTMSETQDMSLSAISIDSSITHGNHTRYQFLTPTGVISEQDLVRAGMTVTPISPFEGRITIYNSDVDASNIDSFFISVMASRGYEVVPGSPLIIKSNPLD